MDPLRLQGLHLERPPSPSQLSKYAAALDGYRSRGIQALGILSFETVPGFPVLRDDEGAWAIA